jgi:hypothetical protein
MARDEKTCACVGAEPEGHGRRCDGEERLAFWCDICRRPVAEKRCPGCGLKTRRMAKGNASGQ